jgi:hypothetical protein
MNAKYIEYLEYAEYVKYIEYVEKSKNTQATFNFVGSILRYYGRNETSDIWTYIQTQILKKL